MKTFARRIQCGLTVLALLPGASLAGDRDAKTDLIAVSSRMVKMYVSSTPHNAGDTDGQFIEDEVIPAVHEVVVRGGAQLTKAQYLAALDFIIASKPLASEGVSDIAAALYLPQKARLCSSIAAFSQSRRKIVLDQVRSGLAAAGRPLPRVICNSK
ncbi:hypothetical protein [Stenotrophomonas sp.]|uniref:hypothetical protein n=1 Tax=Stenotrophomonas sp. TaxID=69392 RepID=UPI0028A7EC8F|nr:hypothetical protein [Stenotrophomonas sp.]